MSVSEQIADLNTNLAAAKSAVETAGGTVGDTGLAGLATEIASIPSGGGGTDLFELFGVNSLPVEPTEVDYKYAAMEWTFEPDVKDGGDMGGPVIRSLKLNGEYVYDMEYHEGGEEEWEMPYYSKSLKSKFNDIRQLNYIKPISLNLTAWANSCQNQYPYFYIDWYRLGDYIDLYLCSNVVAFPRITITGSPFNASTYNAQIDLPGALIGSSSLSDLSNMYSPNLLKIAYSFTYDIDLVDSESRMGLSADKPFDFSTYNNLRSLTIKHSSLTPKDSGSSSYYLNNLYFGNLGQVEYLDMENTDTKNVNYVFSDSITYSMIQQIGGVTNLSKFQLYNASKNKPLYVKKLTGNIGTTLSSPTITLPSWSTGTDKRVQFDGEYNKGYAPIWSNLTFAGGGTDTIYLTMSSSYLWEAVIVGGVAHIDMSGITCPVNLENAQMYFNGAKNLRSIIFPPNCTDPSFASKGTYSQPKYAGPFLGCFQLNTIDMSGVSFSNDTRKTTFVEWLAGTRNTGYGVSQSDVPKDCAITVKTQDIADALTTAGFTNVTVASS